MIRLLGRLVFSVAVVFAGPAAAQSQFYGSLFAPDRTREQVLVLVARVAGSPGSSGYDYEVRAVSRSRPDGYYFVYWRNGCVGGQRARSWGFKPWNGSQVSGDFFDLMTDNQARAFTHAIECQDEFPKNQPVAPGRETEVMKIWLDGP
ncbi:MAG: hypothetical protein Q8J89_12845 [Caulobacter sp.]|nr:hypothetical protein [Caulobacter sp.]